MSATLVIDDREFKRSLAKYMAYTQKTTAQVLNQKGYRVAQKAVWYTRKADRNAIRGELNSIRSVKGRPVPLAALIVNARKKRGGKPGLYGKEMRAAIRRMINARVRAVGYLRSGFIAAREALKPFARLKGFVGISGEEQPTNKYGNAVAAVPGWRTFVEFWTTSITTSRNQGKTAEARAWTFSKDGLQMAFDAERLDTIRYLEREMRKDARRAGIAVF